MSPTALPIANGGKATNAGGATTERAKELESLLTLITTHLLPWISAGDSSAGSLLPDGFLQPRELQDALGLELPATAGGAKALEEIVEKTLRYSVNTWNPGFMDKLYASTDPVGVAADLVLSVLNTNVHVYGVSPALTIIEKETARKFAGLFGFNGPNAGGLTCPGGSASNWTSMLIARNTLFPETKMKGNGDRKFVVFTSRHGHYSVEKAAVLLGIGSEGVWSVEVDDSGCMDVADLERKILLSKSQGFTPFYVNAGAGTTVLGSFDPFPSISALCRTHNLWFHVDGSWGGAVAFSRSQRWRLKGAELADSLTVNPHKMLGVPVTCSFLLTGDTKRFHRATSLKAGYLFHEKEGEDDEVYDMAQMTMGCGRRADSFKMALSWIYYGTEGYEAKIDHSFKMAKYLADAVQKSPKLHLVSENPPPCLQVCFFYKGNKAALEDDIAKNTAITRKIAELLIKKNFMIDYSPSEKGEFLRVVINRRNDEAQMDRLVRCVEELGDAVSKQ